MKKQKSSYRMYLLCVIIFMMACNGSAALPTLTVTPSPSPTSTPIPPFTQWVSGAMADSKLVGQPVGRPNTLRCGTLSVMGDAEVLDVYF